MQAFLKGASIQSSKPQKDKAAAGPSGEKKQRQFPGRPKCVDEVAFQEEVVAVLKKSLEGADLPNLLFYGPPGTGKTSTILAAARELFGPELYRQRVLELNASDERGIQVVREKVKNFAQLTVAGSRSDGKPCGAQENHGKESRTTRFCLICNYISRIIEPLTSRCSKFRFKPLANKIQHQRLLDICEKENLKYTNESIEALVRVSEGDLRKAITYLQSAARLNTDKEITEKTIVEIAGNIVDEGYAATQILCQLHEVIIERDISDKQKSAITEKMAVVDKCLADGADEYLQMLSLCSNLPRRGQSIRETSQHQTSPLTKAEVLPPKLSVLYIKKCWEHPLDLGASRRERAAAPCLPLRLHGDRREGWTRRKLCLQCQQKMKGLGTACGGRRWHDCSRVCALSARNTAASVWGSSHRLRQTGDWRGTTARPSALAAPEQWDSITGFLKVFRAEPCARGCGSLWLNGGAP
ncbi:hypothetical protein WMY93_024984 [Mugilogobius chulae]|uniref:AAA+ ATPase domain-containing protein n=1 Tax=Mugilogobius chulae TaxID=88201 RepID=A0AAW0ND51_9GOBI